MTDIDLCDPDLLAGWGAEPFREEVSAFIETKSGDPPEVLRTLLDDMTAEMREQFNLFKKLRAAAESVAEGEDEAAAKLARADMKAAIDAMSLIVRTLEKIDALQRQMARDRELESERHAEATGYDDAKQRLAEIIEQRVVERVEAVLAERGGGEGTRPPEPASQSPP